MFGGLIARSEEQAGAKFQQTGEQFLNVYDQLASTQAYSDYQRQVTDLLYGNPEAGVKGYLSMTGQEAMDALPQVRQKMEALVGQIKSGLKTNGAQIEFERGSRRLQSYMLEQAGRHYDSQSKVWGASVQDGALAANDRLAANSYNDEEGFLHIREDNRRAAVQKAQLLGHDPTGAIAEADSRAVQARLNGALAQRDYAAADKIFQQYGNLLDDKIRPAYENHIHSGIGGALGDDIYNSAIGRPPRAPGQPAQAPEQYKGLITDSAAKYNVPPELLTRLLDAENGFKAQGVSPKGARGIAQFMPQTAARYGINPDIPEEAIPGAAHYLADLKAEKGTWLGALTGYLGGDPRNDASYTRAGAWQFAQSLDSGKGTAATPAPEVWGDSLGVGLQRQLKTEGTVHGGDTPATIFNNIKAQPEERWQGKTIVLPSGSNGNEMPVVEDTIKYLKDHGANVIAVGYGPKFPDKNAELSAIAQRQNVPVIAAEDVGAAEGVHPSPAGYQKMAAKIQAQMAPPAPDQIAPTGGRRAAPIPTQSALPPEVAQMPSMVDLANREVAVTQRYNQALENIESDPRAIQSPEAMQRAFQRADRDFNRDKATINAYRQAILEARSASVDQLTQKILKGPVSPELLDQIDNDPHLDGPTRAGLAKLAADPPGRELKSAQAWQNALALFNRMNLPAGNADKITDMSPVIDSAAKGDLLAPQIDWLQKKLSDQRTPEGERQTKAVSDLIKAVEPLIDHSNPLMGKIDESGKLNLGMFAWDLDQKIAAAKGDQSKIGELLNPHTYANHPELLSPYQKTLQQSLKDRVSGLTGQRTPVAPPSAASVGIQERQPGESIQDYMKRVGMGLVPSAAAQPSVPLAR